MPGILRTGIVHAIVKRKSNQGRLRLAYPHIIYMPAIVIDRFIAPHSEADAKLLTQPGRQINLFMKPIHASHTGYRIDPRPIFTLIDGDFHIAKIFIFLKIVPVPKT